MMLSHREISSPYYLTRVPSTFFVTRAEEDVVNGFPPAGRPEPPLTPLVRYHLYRNVTTRMTATNVPSISSLMKS